MINRFLYFYRFELIECRCFLLYPYELIFFSLTQLIKHLWGSTPLMKMVTLLSHHSSQLSILLYFFVEYLKLFFFYKFNFNQQILTTTCKESGGRGVTKFWRMWGQSYHYLQFQCIITDLNWLSCGILIRTFIDLIFFPSDRVWWNRHPSPEVDTSVESLCY